MTIDDSCMCEDINQQCASPRCVNRTCQWYLLCTNPATQTRSHPILGAVPICDRCQEKCDRL